MNQRTSKVLALRYVVALINAVDLPPDWIDDYSDEKWDDWSDKVLPQIRNIAKSIESRAVKMGGPFNPFSGISDNDLNDG